MLIAIQKREGLTDIQLAKQLGIHPISWNRKKKGRDNTMSREFLSKAVRAYPELAPTVLQEIFGDDWRVITTNVFQTIIQEMRNQELINGKA